MQKNPREEHGPQGNQLSVLGGSYKHKIWYLKATICTYSTFFDHSGGLLKVMNTQLVKIVHIMIMLNTVGQSQGAKGHSGDSLHSLKVPKDH